MPKPATFNHEPTPWWRMLLRYVLLSTLLHLVWEIVQLPLYTLWSQGSRDEIVFAVMHCTGGDVLIASISLFAAWLLAGAPQWPSARFWPVAALTLLLGLSYTGYSEWHNTTVSQTWAYAEAMPRLMGIGLSPLAQWVVVPALVLAAVRRLVKLAPASQRHPAKSDA